MVENAKERVGPPRHSEEEKHLAFPARGCPGPRVPESFHLRASGVFAVDKSLMISKNAMDVDRREWWIAGCGNGDGSTGGSTRFSHYLVSAVLKMFR